MDKLFLLDAYAIIYRSYYAFINAPRINSKGMNTSTIMGFCNTLNEVLTKEKPTHIAVAFDHGKTFRHDAFPAYKAQRQETPEDIKLSIPIIKDILNAFHIPILQVDGFEADDIIGTIAHKADLEGMQTYMVTPDKDYAQLVTDNVFMYRPRHGGGYDTMGPKEVCEKYGISNTAQVIDLLGLMGDSSDNFPGCPGVGEKTAVKLIMQFGNIETLLSSTDQIKGKMREKVEGAKEDIKMSKFLATIRQDVPVTITFDEMKVSEPDETRLREIFTELEFKSLADRILKKSAPKPKVANMQLDLFGESTAVVEDVFTNLNLDTFKTSGAKYHLIETEDDARKLSELIVTNKLVLTYLFHLHLLLHPSLSSRYPLSLLHNYLFTSYYYLVYTLSHFHLLHNFIYFHSSSHSLLMIHFHNFILLHYSMSSNLMSSHSFLHYYLM